MPILKWKFKKGFLDDLKIGYKINGSEKQPLQKARVKMQKRIILIKNKSSRENGIMKQMTISGFTKRCFWKEKTLV